jgi:hypothetical protein
VINLQESKVVLTEVLKPPKSLRDPKIIQYLFREFAKILIIIVLTPQMTSSMISTICKIKFLRTAQTIKILKKTRKARMAFGITTPRY